MLGRVSRVDGDLSARCSAALQTVLGALGKKTGTEDTRTPGLRRHDALDGAYPRLIAVVHARAIAAVQRPSCLRQSECREAFPWRHRVRHGQAQ